MTSGVASSVSTTSVRGRWWVAPPTPRFRDAPVPTWHRDGRAAPHADSTCLKSVGYGQPAQHGTYRNYTLASTDSEDDRVTPGWRQDLTDCVVVGKLIGAGSFGQVRLGTWTSSGEKVAIKTMAKVRGKLSKADTLVKILGELDMLKHMQGCPGVIRLLDCFEDKGSVHMVMELCRGGDLKKYVEECGPLPEEALVVVAFEILKFLKACHDRYMVYADVKPANFCLVDMRPFDNDNGRPQQNQPVSYLKAIDMGSSQLTTGSGRLQKRHGTLVYMAPEVLFGNYSLKADIWSLGISLYWLFSQSFPYWPDGDEPPLVRMDIMEELASALVLDWDALPEPWNEMSSEGRDFISGCLRVNEAERFSVAQALQHPWISKLAAQDGCAGVQCEIPISKGACPVPSFEQNGPKTQTPWPAYSTTQA